MGNKSHDTRPNTVHEAIEGMALRLNPDVAGDLQATIQFNVSSSNSLKTGGDYYLNIADGKCEFSFGTIPNPMLIIHTPSEIWLSISRGELDGQAALMQGKYTVDGDFNLLLKLDEMFRR